jgi:FdhE protein
LAGLRHALCFCKNDDHERLLSLVPDNGAANRRIEGCQACAGYLKSLNTLQGADPLSVMLDDLATVDLDIAAIEQGLRRPDGSGYPLNPTVGYSKTADRRRVFPWSR